MSKHHKYPRSFNYVTKQEWISRAAYFFWLQEGKPRGRDKEFWYKAEKAWDNLAEVMINLIDSWTYDNKEIEVEIATVNHTDNPDASLGECIRHRIKENAFKS